jgi:transcriptional regulator with XRE-family HTH domain
VVRLVEERAYNPHTRQASGATSQTPGFFLITADSGGLPGDNGMNSLNNTSRIPRETAASTSPGSPVLVLTAWKEIARYMGKGVRTVQRWESDFGLPVRRPSGSKSKRAVLAFGSDLDAWIALHCSRGERNLRTAVNQLTSAPLRDQVRAAAELRIANRLLLNEIHIAVESLRQQMRMMCPPASPEERNRP